MKLGIGLPVEMSALYRATMAGVLAVLATATDGSSGQYGVPGFWLIVLAVVGAAVVVAVVLLLVRAMKRPAPWDTTPARRK